MIKKVYAQSKIHEHLKIFKKSLVSKTKWLHLFRIYAKTSFSNICINFKQMKIAVLLQSINYLHKNEFLKIY